MELDSGGPSVLLSDFIVRHFRPREFVVQIMLPGTTSNSWFRSPETADREFRHDAAGSLAHSLWWPKMVFCLPHPARWQATYPLFALSAVRSSGIDEFESCCWWLSESERVRVLTSPHTRCR